MSEYVLKRPPTPSPAEAGGAASAAPPPRGDALGLSTTHIRPRKSDLWQLNAHPGGSLMAIHGPGGRGQRGGGKRGIVQRFSEASRRRLLRALCRVKRDCLPIFITLTYPDGFPGDPRQWKDDLKTWLKRVARQFPEAAGFWKLELKTRKSGLNQGQVAPHFHLLLWGIPESWEQADGNVWTYRFLIQDHETAAPGLIHWKQERWRNGQLYYGCESFLTAEENAGAVREFVTERVNKQGEHIRIVESWKEDKTGRFEALLAERTENRRAGVIELKHWVSLTWAEVVNSGDPRHVRAGTRVEQIRSREGVLFYAAKYVGKLDTEAVGNAGRFWGIHNVSHVPWAEAVQVPLTQEQAVRLMRVARRYIWSGQRQREHPKKIRWRANCGMTFFGDAGWWLERLAQIAGG